MEDFREMLTQSESHFATDKAWRQYLMRLRWPEGFRCPRCADARAWPVRTVLLQGARCGYQTSVTAGTIFQNSRKHLTLWFPARLVVDEPKDRPSALGLQRVLGLGSYKTAWTWRHKMRRAMVRPGRDQLSRRIEVDETYLGGVEGGSSGRGVNTKALIVVAAQEDGKGNGTVRLRRVPDASASSLIPFVRDSIGLGSAVHTDGWLGYKPLTSNGCRHKVTFLKGTKRSPRDLLPHVHGVVSLLKRWLMGTHHGGVSHRHLDYYLDEFTFRLNRQTSQHRGKLFYRLFHQAATVDLVPYRALIEEAGAGPEQNHNVLALPE